MLRWNIFRKTLGLFLLFLFLSVPAFGKQIIANDYGPEIFKFDPDWEPKDVNPFVLRNDGYALNSEIGAADGMTFPKVLDSQSPIIINTKFGKVQQFLNSNETYRAELAGRYLVYRGKKQSILFRYDKDKMAFREFVYLPSAGSLNKDGTVIRWRYEGANLTQRKDGSVAFMRTVDLKGDIKKVADSNMSARISRFLEKRRGKALPDKPVSQTLFVTPAPEYVDGELNTITQGIHYETQVSELALVLNEDVERAFPLWVDPTLTPDADAAVILNPKENDGLQNFGYSVASAGDFNGDGVDDVIVGAYTGGPWPRRGSAFVFLGKKAGVISDPEANADVVLFGPENKNNFGRSVASAGDFNGDGKDDVIIGASRAVTSGSAPGSAFIFFGRDVDTTDSSPPLLIDLNDINTSADVFLDGPIDDDFFGWNVASAGDFNDDGKDDVLVTNHVNPSKIPELNKGYLFFGGVTGAKSAATDADVIFIESTDVKTFGNGAASAGDFNDDGIDDIILGFSNVGHAYIFFGRDDLLLDVAGSIPPLIIDNLTANANVFLDGHGWLFGISVASAGDFNGDGIDDVIVGAPEYAGADGGRADIFFGFESTLDGLGNIIPVTIDLSGADVTIYGWEQSAKMGNSVASAGDFNGDGKDDVIIGASGAGSKEGSVNTGKAYIFFGGVTGAFHHPNTCADVYFKGVRESFKSAFGKSVASAGDFSGDGKNDVIIGGRSSSSAYVFSGFQPSDSPRTAVVADAGSDQTKDEGTFVRLLGNGSFHCQSLPISDPFNFGLNYDWKQLAGPTVTLDLSNPARPTFTAPPFEAGNQVLTFELIVDNGQNSSAPDTVDIVLVSANTNTPPVADAGADQIVEQGGPSGSNVALSGLGSSDPDGDPLAYTWSGPFGTATGATPTVLIPAGIHTVTLTVNDGSLTGSDTVLITVKDTTAPVITVADRTVEATGPSTPVDVSGDASATDAVGVVSLTSNSPGTFPLGATTVTWTAIDAAGNSSTAVQNVTIVDTTPPAVTAPANVTVFAIGPLTPADIGTGTAEDLVDGILIPTPDNLGPFPPGATTVTWSATDATGNTGTATQTVIVVYPFSGFEPPIDNLPIVNSGKAGQTIPVKWNIPDGSGGFIQDLGIISSINFQGISCASDSLESELPSEEAVSGGSGLRYSGGHFIFNWQTSESMAKECFLLILTLNDGNQHLAKFSLK
jgi:FG-GAP repeat/PKD domain